MIVGELMVLIAGNNAALTGALAGSEAELKGFSSTAGTHGGIASSALHAIGLAAVGAGAVTAVGLGLAAKSAGDFQEQMNIINTIAHQTPAELDKTGSAIRAMSVATGEPLDNMTKAFYDLLSAGVSVRDAMPVLHNATTLAIGGLATTAQTVDLLTTAINSYHLNAAGATKATDQFALAVQDGKVKADQIAETFADVAPLAKQAGVGIDEIATTYAVLTARGTPAAEATTQMNRAMVELLKPNADLNALMDKTHENFAQIAANKGLVVALQDMREAAAANGVPFQDLFGRLEGLKFALATTGPNFAAYQDELGKMHHANGTAAAQAEERMHGFDRAVKILGASLNDLAISIGKPLLDFLTSIVDHMSAGVQAIDKWVQGFPNLAAALGSLVPQGGPIRAVFDAIATGLGALPGVVGGAIGAIQGAAGAIGQWLTQSGAFQAAAGILHSAFAAIQTALAALPGFISAAAGAISGAIGTFSQWATSSGLIADASGAIQAAIAALPGIVSAAADAIGGAFSGALASIQGAIGWLDEHRNVIPLVAGAVGGPLVLAFAAWAVSAGAAAAATALALAPLLLIGAAVGVLAAAFITDFGGIHTAVTGAIGVIAPIIQGVLGAAIGFVSNAIGTVVGWITNFISHLTGAHTSAQGLGGILQTLGTVLSTVAGIIGTVVGMAVQFAATVIDNANKLGLFKAAGDLIYGMFGLLGTTIGNIVGLFGQMAGVVAGGLTIAFNAIGAVIGTVTDAIKAAIGAIQSMIDLAGKAVGAVSSIPGVKLGGDVVGGVGDVGRNILGLIPHAEGLWNVAQDHAAFIHAGEMVVPADIASALRSGGNVGGAFTPSPAAGGGGAITHITHTHVYIDSREIAEVIDRELFGRAQDNSSGFTSNPGMAPA